MPDEYVREILTCGNNLQEVVKELLIPRQIGKGGRGVRRHIEESLEIVQRHELVRKSGGCLFEPVCELGRIEISAGVDDQLENLLEKACDAFFSGGVHSSFRMHLFF